MWYLAVLFWLLLLLARCGVSGLAAVQGWLLLACLFSVIAAIAWPASYPWRNG